MAKPKNPLKKPEIVVAIIAAIVTIVVAYFQFVWKPTQQNKIPQEYIGRVLDNSTQAPIPNAKITLDLPGLVPQISYTDTEGVYLFNLNLTNDQRNGHVRVDADGYETYSRNISLSADVLTIEDIRLSPKSLSGDSANPSALEIEKWSADFFGNINLNAPSLYHTVLSAEKNDKGGYVIKFNSLDVQSNQDIPNSEFSIRLSGIFIFESGYYEFHCQHHDGCRVYVDGRNWIDAWWDGEGGHDLARDISAGNHIVTIEFYDKSGIGFFEVFWRLKK